MRPRFDRADFDPPHNAVRARRGRDLDPVALGAVVLNRAGEVDSVGVGRHPHGLDRERRPTANHSENEQKGDANEEADPWTAQLDGDRVWTVRRAVPYVGQGILWLRSPAVHRWFTIFVPALVVILVLRGIWRRPDDTLPDALPDANVYRA